MNTDQETRWQSLPPFVIALLLAVGSYWWIPWPLYGERPPQSYSGIPLEGVQQAEARLWQDPFAAAQRHRGQEAARPSPPSLQGDTGGTPVPGDAPRGLDWLKDVAAAKCPEGTRCEILGVMVFGGPYVGMEEYRRYVRYAVLAGLNSHDYIPEDTEHVGYLEPGQAFQVRASPSTGGMSAGVRGLPPVLPFEWFAGEKEDKHLLLLWLDEDALTRQYFDEGRRTLEQGIIPRLTTLFQPFADMGLESLNIIGPASSGTLSLLSEEWSSSAGDEGWPRAGGGTLLDRSRWFSASATSDKAWAAAKRSGLPVTRVIAKDSDLATGLVGELMQRGLQPRDTVALIGQLDTAYSRNLITLLRTELEGLFREGEVQVLTAHYLRGIDGERPGVRKGGEQTKEDQGKKSDRESPRKDKVERPEGDGQIDYIRRLTVELARQHQAYKPGGEIRAVGVLGDDYHDKLLVLKALRRAFPDAVFFTTDLHAAMLHPVDNPHTRNLVVASAFGLELEPALQAGFAPFRSSYQTASYLATRLALLASDSRAEGPPLGQDRIDERISPLVFEIGRSAPVRLNTPPASGTDAKSGCGPQRWEWLECQDWQPARQNHPTGKTLAGILLATFGGLALGATVSVSIRCFLLHHWRALLATAALAAAFAIWLIVNLPNPLGEPFSWLEGVSVWPTEILRLITVALTIALFSSGIRTLRHSDRSIREHFFGDKGHEGAGGAKDGSDPRTPGGEGNPVPVTSIWRLYQARQFRIEDLSRHLADAEIRVIPSWLKRHFVLQSFKPVLVYLIVGVGLTLALGRPHTPARGAGMFMLDQVVLIAAVASFLMLLFFTLNTSRRAVWLAHALSRPSTWPDATLRRFGWREGRAQQYFDDFLDVQLLAEATSGVQRLVYYPFLVFFILVLSRTRLFDGWHISLSLYLIFALAGLLMLVAAIRLRRAAEDSRSRALERMNGHLLRIIGEEGSEGVEQQLRAMIDLTKRLRKGAYSPFGEQPIVRAILGLGGGIYAIALVEWVNMAGL